MAVRKDKQARRSFEPISASRHYSSPTHIYNLSPIKLCVDLIKMIIILMQCPQCPSKKVLSVDDDDDNAFLHSAVGA
jgi:hypothetical protein